MKLMQKLLFKSKHRNVGMSGASNEKKDVNCKNGNGNKKTVVDKDNDIEEIVYCDGISKYKCYSGMNEKTYGSLNQLQSSEPCMKSRRRSKDIPFPFET